MDTLRSVRLVLAAAGLMAIVGCAPSKEEMEAMLRQPPRPPALDQLDSFAGNWTSTAKITSKGQEGAEESTGKSSAQWDLDKRVLVEHFEYSMGKDSMGKDNVKKGVSLMWYDTSARKYRTTSADNYGGYSCGTMTYDDKLGKWKMSGAEWDKDGHKTVMHGTCAKVDDKTMQWEFTACMPGTLGLVKYFEGTGTSKKQ